VGRGLKGRANKEMLDKVGETDTEQKVRPRSEKMVEATLQKNT